MNRFLPILLIAAFSASAHAANILVTSTITTVANGGSLFHGAAGSQVSMLNSAGIALPVGSQVRLGFFLNYTAALDSTLRSGNLNSLFTGANRFIPFGELTSPTGYGTASEATNDIKEIAGIIRASVTYQGITYIGNDNDVAAANTLTSGGVARGTKVFMFLYNSQSLDTSGTGFEYGLYSASNWLIPAAGTADASIQLQHADTSSEVFYGSLGSLRTAVPVPEPTAVTFGIAVIGMALVRRRRQ
ncbi:MAG: hypothetical protein V4675_06475 [Verrucomicrobiota bacterium]